MTDPHLSSPSTAQQTVTFGTPRTVASQIGDAPLSHSHPENGENRTNSTYGMPAPVEHAPTAPQSTWVGKRIDKYIVERLLGGGGMGEVFLGKHRWLDVPVAIKILRPMFGHDAVAMERFHREAKLVALMNHPNIVRAVDGGPIDDSCYLVTEFLDGMDLADIVAKRGPLLPSEACAIICEMAKGLHYAHNRHLVHRDIKPQNAMVLKDGTVKILDLGLARVTLADAQTQMTATGQFMGTVDYVSPEQAIDTSEIDHRADIYSLGCTLYFLLTGQPPFHGDGYESVVSKILAHTDEVPQAINLLRSNVPRKLIQIVDKMMAKSPDDRYQTAEEVGEVLSRFAKPIDPAKIFEQGSFVVNQSLTRQQTSFADQFVSGVAAAVISVLLFALKLAGIVEQVEVNSNSRGHVKPRYRTQVSFSGLFTWIIIAGLALFFFSTFEFVYVEY